MDKMRMESINLTEQNIEKIGAMFPNVISEAKDENGKLKKAINFALLKQVLSNEVIDGDEAYEFTWVGKKLLLLKLESLSGKHFALVRKKVRIGILLRIFI